MSEEVVDVGRGITLAYETLGSADGDPLLLVAGLGMQLTSYPDDFCAELVERGYRVVRYDNRDVGASTHLDFPPPRIRQLLARRWHPRQYTLEDMADDADGLLGALGIASAHVVGVSMGGMIAQMLASRHPRRVRSLTSIMSTSGGLRVGRPALSTARLMLGPMPRDRDEAMERAVRMFRHIGTTGYPFDEAYIRHAAGVSWDRDPANAGTGRQLGAIVRSGNRRAALRRIVAPTLVIHSDRDRMVSPSGGAATAAAIPGSRLVTIRGLGHDLPRGAWPRLIELIDEHARSAAHASK